MGDRFRILVADGDPEIHSFLRGVFEGEDYRIESFFSGEEALSGIAAGGFDLAITDMKIKGTSGVELLRRMKDVNPDLPVVVITEFTSVREVVEALQNGAYNFITKPLRAEEVGEVVRKGLRIHRKLKSNKDILPYLKHTIEIGFPSRSDLLSGTIYQVVERIKELGYTGEQVSDITLSLDEALANAIEHGNRGDPTKSVHLKATLSAERVRISVRDEGEGFDYRAIPNPKDEEHRFKGSGRGVFLIKCFMDSVRFNESGNEITFVKYRLPRGKRS
ncbi:MAG: ATP-binding protein [bacterium]